MIAAVAGLPWAAVSALRVALYRNGWKRTARLDRRTLSVGALEMGGTGKTPVTIAVARLLADTGLRPAILSRGYRRASSGAVLVSSGDGTGPALNAEQAGDEPWLMAHLLPGVPVAVATHREQAAALIESPVDVYILDDGFQHVRVARDVDLVVVDANQPFWSQSPPPLGRLRERWQAAGRATAFVVHGDQAELARRWPAIPRFQASAAPPGFVPLAVWLSDATQAGRETLPTGTVAAFAGIARPERFFRTLEAAGIEPVLRREYPDHHRFSDEDMRGLARDAVARGAELLLTTEKDAARLAELDVAGLDLWVVSHRVHVDPSDELRALCSEGAG